MISWDNQSQPLREQIDSDLQMKAKVRVQYFPDHTMRVKLEDIKFYIMGEEADLMNARGILDGYNKMTSKHDDQKFMRYLKEPVIVLLKGNVFKKLFVSKDEPENVTNLKKSLVKELKSNGSSPNLQQLKTNNLSSRIEIPFQPKEIIF